MSRQDAIAEALEQIKTVRSFTPSLADPCPAMSVETGGLRLRPGLRKYLTEW
jgi:hypothetical protein